MTKLLMLLSLLLLCVTADDSTTDSNLSLSDFITQQCFNFIHNEHGDCRNFVKCCQDKCPPKNLLEWEWHVCFHTTSTFKKYQGWKLKGKPKQDDVKCDCEPGGFFGAFTFLILYAIGAVFVLSIAFVVFRSCISKCAENCYRLCKKRYKNVEQDVED